MCATGRHLLRTRHLPSFICPVLPFPLVPPRPLVSSQPPLHHNHSCHHSPSPSCHRATRRATTTPRADPSCHHGTPRATTEPLVPPQNPSCHHGTPRATTEPLVPPRNPSCHHNPCATASLRTTRTRPEPPPASHLTRCWRETVRCGQLSSTQRRRQSMTLHTNSTCSQHQSQRHPCPKDIILEAKAQCLKRRDIIAPFPSRASGNWAPQIATSPTCCVAAWPLRLWRSCPALIYCHACSIHLTPEQPCSHSLRTA